MTPGLTQTAGSNTVSPTKGGPSTPRAVSPPASAGPVEGWEIVQILNTIPQGVTVTNLLKRFQTRVGDEPGQMPRKEWIKIVKDNASFGPDKLLRAKGAPQSPGPAPGAASSASPGPAPPQG